MTKIVLNGAGSVEFTKELLADILGFEDLAGSTIALYDTSAERLETAAAIARWTAGALGVPATVEPYLDRRAALDGADHVISMIRVGGHEGLRLDFEIPGRHAVRQTMADTLGIGSIFRALCTIPALLELARELHEVAPGAWLYNYTNPMAALVWAIYAGTAHRARGSGSSWPTTRTGSDGASAWRCSSGSATFRPSRASTARTSCPGSFRMRTRSAASGSP